MGTRVALLIAVVAAHGVACDDPLPPRGDGSVDSAVDAPGFDGSVDNDGDGLSADRDCDDEDASISTFDSRSCTGECDSFIIECRNGLWDDCPETCDCEPGETRDVGCPMCGTRSQTCGPDGSWMDATECASVGVCEAGTEERMGPCGRCPGGELIRRCTDACTWDVPVCDTSAATCNAWLLPPGARSWERIGLPREGGPTNIRAAWFIEGVERVWVMGDRVHELDPACLSSGIPSGCWVADGTRTSYFSAAVQSDNVYFGHSVPTVAFDTTEQQLTVITETSDHQYFRNPSTGAMRLVTNPATTWTDPDAPSSRSAVRAGFPRVEERDGWATRACGSPAMVPDGYLVYVSPEVSLFTLPFPECGFFEEQPYAAFPPFTYPNRPALSAIGAAAYSDRFGLLILPANL